MGGLGKMGKIFVSAKCAKIFVKWLERGQWRGFMSKRLKIFENV